MKNCAGIMDRSTEGSMVRGNKKLPVIIDNNRGFVRLKIKYLMISLNVVTLFIGAVMWLS